MNASAGRYLLIKVNCIIKSKVIGNISASVTPVLVIYGNYVMIKYIAKESINLIDKYKVNKRTRSLSARIVRIRLQRTRLKRRNSCSLFTSI